MVPNDPISRLRARTRLLELFSVTDTKKPLERLQRSWVLEGMLLGLICCPLRISPGFWFRDVADVFPGERSVDLYEEQIHNTLVLYNEMVEIIKADELFRITSSLHLPQGRTLQRDQKDAILSWCLGTQNAAKIATRFFESFPRKEQRQPGLRKALSSFSMAVDDLNVNLGLFLEVFPSDQIPGLPPETVQQLDHLRDQGASFTFEKCLREFISITYNID